LNPKLVRMKLGVYAHSERAKGKKGQAATAEVREPIEA
jgi:hypothetical protein